jgi:hypothetical protein
MKFSNIYLAATLTIFTYENVEPSHTHTESRRSNFSGTENLVGSGTHTGMHSYKAKHADFIPIIHLYHTPIFILK